MPLAVVASAAAPPLRPPEPFRFLHTPKRVTLTSTPSLQCSPSLPVEAPPAEPKPKPRRYPKQFPGEAVGVAEEMRFVAMRLRNPKRTTLKEEAEEETKEEEEGEGWMPTVEGFVRYLVDSKLVFDTVERIIAESTDVAYVYFRKSGLERSASIAKDLEWFKEQEVEIPEPSSYGTTYAAYLTELAESNAPAFLSHYYNIYFAHITGGVAIGSKICKKILEGREMELYKWDNDVELLLKDARKKLNELSKHWSRKDRNLCLKEAAKCFQYLGRIVRLIIS